MKIAFLLLVACGAIASLLFWMEDPRYLRAPKDSELITIFQEHHLVFERLHQIAVEDKVWNASDSALAGRVSDGRGQEYKRLLGEIRPGLVFKRGPYSDRFIFAEGAILAIGPEWLKGIEWVPGSTPQVGVAMEDLDHPASIATDGVYFRQIQPHWYIFFQNTD